MSAPLLEVGGLDAFYGPAQVLFDVSFRIAPGEVVALVGRNGAGKSTTMRALVGLVPRRSVRRLHLDGRDVAGLPTHAVAAAGLGWVPEERRIFTELTVEENLLVGRRPPRPGAPTWTADALYALFPNLAEMRGRLGGRMSGGEQQMLAIARTLVGNPALVLLDEPSEGLAPRIVEQMAEALAAVKRAGLAMLVSEQNLRVVRLVADRVLVIERGRIRFDGGLADLEADAEVRDAGLAV